MHCFCQHSASKAFNVQVFYENHSELAHQLASPLVLVVVTLLEDVLVNLLQPHDRFATTLGTLLAACYTTLRTAQLLLRLTVQTRVLDGAAIRQHGEHTEIERLHLESAGYAA